MVRNKKQFVRFGIVGTINTALDFGLLFVLKSLGLPVIMANVISTSIAFVFSFIANKKFTFKASDTNIAREMTLYVIVTLFGLWVLQSPVIHFTKPVFADIMHNDSLALFAAKGVATIVTLVWNYTLYDRVVFKNR